MKQLLFVFTLFIFVPVFLSAQEKELYIRYDYYKNYILNIDEGLTDKSRLNELNNRTNTRKRKSRPKKVEVFAQNGLTICRLHAFNMGRVANGKVIPGISDPFYTYVKSDYKQSYLLETVFCDRSNYEILLKEPLNLFNWKLCNETKDILGYNCNKATCTFRGRDYEAWFTRKIPFKAAPWKFHGLPGVILEVYTTDDFLKWTAKELEIRSPQTKIEFPSKGLKIIELEEYKEIIQKKEQRNIELHKRFNIEQAHNPKAIFSKHVPQQNSLEIFDLDLKE